MLLCCRFRVVSSGYPSLTNEWQGWSFTSRFTNRKLIAVHFQPIRSQTKGSFDMEMWGENIDEAAKYLYFRPFIELSTFISGKLSSRNETRFLDGLLAPSWISYEFFSSSSISSQLDLVCSSEIKDFRNRARSPAKRGERKFTWRAFFEVKREREARWYTICEIRKWGLALIYNGRSPIQLAAICMAKFVLTSTGK